MITTVLVVFDTEADLGEGEDLLVASQAELISESAYSA